MLEQTSWGDPLARDAYSLVLEAIHEHWRTYKCPPSYRWLGKQIARHGEKPRSNAVVDHAINRLVRDGFIIKESGAESSYPAVIPIEVAKAIGDAYGALKIEIPLHAPSTYKRPAPRIGEKKVRMWIKDNMPGYSTYKKSCGPVGIVSKSDPFTAIEAKGWRELAIEIGMPC
jgi:hypothetical protein